MKAWAAIVAAVALMGVAACGGSSAGGGKSVTTGGDDAAAGGKPVDIVVWHGQNQTAEKVFNRLVARFNASHPRVTADAVVAAADNEADGDARLLADDERARFIAVLRGETRVAAGDEVTLRVDPTRLHAFDPATGESLAGAYTSSTSTPSAASA